MYKTSTWPRNNVKVAEIHSTRNRSKIINNLRLQVYAKAAKLAIFKSIIISSNNNITSDLQAKRTYTKCTLIMVLHREQKLAAKYQYRILKAMVKWEWCRCRANLISSSKRLSNSSYLSYLKQVLQLQDQWRLYTLYPQLISQTTQDKTQQVMLSKIVPALAIVRSVRSPWVWLPMPSPPNKTLNSNNSSNSSNKMLAIFSRWKDRPQPAPRAYWLGKANNRRVKR